MWVKNNDKERIKLYIKSDLNSNITNLTDLSNKIRTLMSEITNSVGSAASGTDMKLIGNCQKSLEVIERALCELYNCNSFAEQLDTMEWINDE